MRTLSFSAIAARLMEEADIDLYRDPNSDRIYATRSVDAKRICVVPITMLELREAPTIEALRARIEERLDHAEQQEPTP